jgi:hypothetical protein
LGKLEWSRLFAPSVVELGESAHEGREAGFMILTIEPCPVPSSKRSFQGENEEASTGTGLETYAPNNLPVGSTRLVLQEEIVFEKRKVRRNPKEDLAEMDENDDSKNGVRVKINQLNLIVVQESVKEIANRDTKPALEEGGEHHNFFCVGCRNVFADDMAQL